MDEMILNHEIMQEQNEDSKGRSNSITTKFMVAFGLILLTVIGGLAYLTITTANEYNKEATQQLYTAISALNQEIEKSVSDAEALAQYFSENAQLVESVSNNNQTGIAEVMDPIYQKFNENMGLSVFEIGDEMGNVLYRAHNPQEFGDSKSHLEIIQHTLNNNAASGLEIGSSGVAVRAFVPLISNQEVVGTMQTGFSDAFFDKYKEIAHADATVYTSEALIYSTATDEQDLVGQTLMDLAISDQAEVERALQGEEVFGESNNSLYYLMPIYNPLESVIIGAFKVTFDTTPYNLKVRNVIVGSIILTAVMLVIYVILFLYLFKYFVQPIKFLAHEIKRISMYDLTNSAVHEQEHLLKQKDEIGEMTNAVRTMEENIRHLVENIAESAQGVTRASEELAHTAAQSNQASDEVAKTIEEIASGATDQAEDTATGAVEVEHLGELLNQLNDQALNLSKSSTLVETMQHEGLETLDKLKQHTEENSRSAQTAVEVIAEMSKESEAVNKISTIIQEIASQTNLLALNAAIEAARAGESGKGFAVVADEIKKLADESQKNAEEISSIIRELSKNITQTVESATKSKAISEEQLTSLYETQDKFVGISKAMDEVNSITDHLRTSSESMVDGKDKLIALMQHLSAISEENAASTEEASASVEEQTASMEEIANASESLSTLALNMQEAIRKVKL